MSEIRAWLRPHAPLPCGTVYPQAAIVARLAHWLGEVPGARPEERAAALALLQRLDAAGAVMSRAASLPDLAPDGGGALALFAAGGDTPWWRPTLEARLTRYGAVSRAVAEAAFPGGDAAPGHLLHVTCTGYEAPSAMQELAARRGWLDATHLLQLGHMGCFAAVPATEVAALIATATKGCVSVLHLELCTLHLRLDSLAPGQVVIDYLFADGAIRYDVLGTPPPGPRFAVLDTFTAVLPGTADAMSWHVADGGFRMSLARGVPAAVAGALPGLVQAFLGRHGLRRGDIGRFAVHPGGTSVLAEIGACLEIDPPALAVSRQVLRERGNMSSATLPHIWRALATDPGVAPGELVLSLAFGPGLTIAGNLLRKES